MVKQTIVGLFLMLCIGMASCTSALSPSDTMETNETIKTILNRKSVRSYAKRSVEQEKIDTLYLLGYLLIIKFKKNI